MVGKPLRILQWNVGKRRESQLSLLNDEKTNDFDILLLQEPYRFTPDGYQRPVVPIHHYWEAILPTKFTPTIHQPFNFRSMIYINKRIKARQIPMDSPDLVAIMFTINSAIFLAISVYIEQRSRVRENNAVLQQNLQKIRQAIEQARIQNPNIQLIIAGDFNRHDELWGGTLGDPSRAGEAEPILGFLAEFQLWSALPQGIPTYRHWGSTYQSTIDLMLVSSNLRLQIQTCNTYETDHGSDHSAIQLALNYQQDSQIPQQRRSYNMANWEEIRKEVQVKLRLPPDITTREDLNQAARHLESIVQQALQQVIPPAKPFPYAKRWWSFELSQLRREYNFRRNLWTSATRRGDFEPSTQGAARKAKEAYHREIARTKKRHWQEFLQDNQNVWKALKYLNGGKKTSSLPSLQKDGTQYEDNQGKAAVLLGTFFPPQPEPIPNQQQEPIVITIVNDPIGKEISAAECRKAIFDSNPRKAPGPDDIPFRVWQETWPVTKEWIIRIYQKSLLLGCLPESWTEARIVVIPKPGKADYSIPKAYRPISLLRTISKGLERVVAQRLSKYLEKEGKLAPTQFGARPRRSTDQALVVLVQRIYTAWRAGKVLSLVTFDVQGAYNGVNKEVLQDRLRKAGVPKHLYRWIDSFCSNRRACISFDGYQSESTSILQPGLPQGSPLSPILYILYNAELLLGKIEKTFGDMGFVDDYTAWVVGDSAEENTQRIQTEIIPRVTQWERESGATFEPEKTQFIHFTRNRPLAQRPFLHLMMNGKAITATPICKILGVYFDEQLRMRTHIQKAAQKALVQANAISTLRGLSPLAMRQLYLSTVAAKLDYAAAVWFQPQRHWIQQAINSVQRTGARAITGAYKSTSTAILELEAGLCPAPYRLLQRLLYCVINLQTLEKNHPWWRIKPKKGDSSIRHLSPIAKVMQLFPQVLESKARLPMETIKPFIQTPSSRIDAIEFIIQQDRVQAIWEANIATPAIFTDGSGRNQVLGVGVASRIQLGLWKTPEPDSTKWKTELKRGWRLGWEMIGSKTDSNEYAAELTAILRALQIVHRQQQRNGIPTITILSDCQSAIVSIQKPRYQSGQHLIKEIWTIARRIQKDGTKIILQWTPGHEGITGNDMAHKSARRATVQRRQPVITIETTIDVRLKSRAMQVARQQINELRRQDFDKKRVGKFTRRLDKALPREHMVKIYDQLRGDEVKILVQLRTNFSPLNQHLRQIRVVESEECDCGNRVESTAHFLFDCPKWIEQRKPLREAMNHRWADLSYALGGWSGRKSHTTQREIDGPRDEWKPRIAVLKAVVQFVKATQRFQPKALADEQET